MKPTLDDKWKAEYEQLSDDFRFYVQMGWQATVAVLATDGLIVSAVVSAKEVRPIFGVLPLIGAILTILMALEEEKWTRRTKGRVLILKTYDRAHGFGRFSTEEKGFLTWPLGRWLFDLMFAVALGLILYALFLFWPTLWPSWL
jgi:hypothetical protein